MLEKTFNEEYLENVLEKTYEFVDKILEMSSDNYKGYIEIPLEYETKIIYINLDLTGGWKSDTLFLDSDGNFYSECLLKKIFGPYFYIDPCKTEFIEEMIEEEDIDILSEIPTYSLYIQCKGEIIDEVREKLTNDKKIKEKVRHTNWYAKIFIGDDMIKRVFDEKLADICDDLLTKLIEDETKYDKTIDTFVVKDYFKNVIINKDNILLCYLDNENPVAYIYLKPIISNSDKGYLIDGLYVKEEYRNKKIASNLIKEALNILNDMQIKFIDINVLYNNLNAKHLYKAFGFEEFKLQMRKPLK